jgi:hypothetical protein
MSDSVVSPSHYNQGAVECIDAIWETGNGRGYCIGNAIKYLWRAGLKGEELEDVEKASFYLRYLLSKLAPEKHADPRGATPVGWKPEDEADRIWFYVGPDSPKLPEIPENLRALGRFVELKAASFCSYAGPALSLPGDNDDALYAHNPEAFADFIGASGWHYGVPARAVRRL